MKRHAFMQWNRRRKEIKIHFSSPVSYTHLDVYKRQVQQSLFFSYVRAAEGDIRAKIMFVMF